MTPKTVTVIVPAFNEEADLHLTIDALIIQTQRPDRIIIVDDCSTDRTPTIAKRYAEEHDHITYLRPAANLGSKARAQNFALAFVGTELVLPIDGDTILAPNYVELIVEPFADDRVAVAAGCVHSLKADTWCEKGRTIEYLHGFHFQRPIQNAANSPVVCSGCCSCFRTQELKDFGGFPERTIVEDMDYTWSKQIEGRRAVYVSAAEAWAVDPANLHFLRKQLKRWMHGFFQNVRIHAGGMRKKPMLGVWVGAAILEIVTAPLWWLLPLVMILGFHASPLVTGGWWLGADLLITMPPLLYAAHKRRISYLKVIGLYPFVYMNKAVNFAYAWRGMIVELVLVPLRLSKGLTVYEKGN